MEANQLKPKMQKERLTDIFFLGPALPFLATRKRKLSDGERSMLFAAGLGMVVYNAHEYLSEERRIEAMLLGK